MAASAAAEPADPQPAGRSPLAVLDRLRRAGADGRPGPWRRLRLPAMILVAALPLLLSSAHTLDLGRVAATDAVVALGYCIVLGLCGQFSLGHAALFAVGAYTTGILTVAHGTPSELALLASIVTATVAGALMGIPALRVGGDVLAVVTLFIAQIAGVVIVNTTTAVTDGTTSVDGIPPDSLFGWQAITLRDEYLLAAAAAIVCAAAVEWLRRSPLGLAMLAVREDEVTARACGVGTGSVKVTAFALSGAVAGLAGWVYAGAVVSVSPGTFDLTLAVLIAVAVLIGGQGRVYGAVAGGGFIAVLADVLQAHPQVEQGATGAAILAVVLWRTGALRAGAERLMARVVTA